MEKYIINVRIIDKNRDEFVVVDAVVAVRDKHQRNDLHHAGTGRAQEMLRKYLNYLDLN